MGLQNNFIVREEQQLALPPDFCTVRRAPRTLHVLTLTPFYPLRGDDGAGCFIAEPLKALEKVGVKNTVLVAKPFYRTGAPINSNSPAATSLRYFSLPKGVGLASSGAFLFSRLVGQFRKLCERNPLDLVHAHGALPCGHAAALLSREFGIPYVITVHGLDAYATRQVRGLAGRWCERVSRMTYERARRVICISERVREEVERGGHCRTEVIYNGVDTELFSPAAEPSDANPVILSVGNLIPIKGHDLLLRAIAVLRKQFSTLRCEIVGEGPERERLGKLAAELGITERIRFCGRLSRRELAARLARCTVFALLSRFEALGCVYLEAMAAGKPVVACRGQGIADIIEDGRNGLLIEPDNLDQLSCSLTSLLQDCTLRRNIAAAGHRTVHQHLTLTHQANNLARVCTECVP
jgi:teichuronic acid biosynthesis glycosyltransferase TuaC